jgi:hypothetical protein
MFAFFFQTGLVVTNLNFEMIFKHTSLFAKYTFTSSQKQSHLDLKKLSSKKNITPSYHFCILFSPVFPEKIGFVFPKKHEFEQN